MPQEPKFCKFRCLYLRKEITPYPSLPHFPMYKLCGFFFFNPLIFIFSPLGHGNISRLSTPVCHSNSFRVHKESMGFPRQEYRSGLPFPSPEDLPHTGIEPPSLALAGRFLTSEPPGKSYVKKYKYMVKSKTNTKQWTMKNGTGNL